MRASLPGGVLGRSWWPVPGIIEALDQITSPVCVASSGSHNKMMFTLGKTRLIDGFDGPVWGGDEVAHGKPAPDIFLFAANRIGAAHRSMCMHC